MQQSFKNRFSKVDWDAKTQLKDPISLSCKSLFFNSLNGIHLLDFYSNGNRISLFLKRGKLITQIVAKIGKGNKAKTFQLQTVVYDVNLSEREMEIELKIN